MHISILILCRQSSVFVLSYCNLFAQLETRAKSSFILNQNHVTNICLTPSSANTPRFRNILETYSAELFVRTSLFKYHVPSVSQKNILAQVLLRYLDMK